MKRQKINGMVFIRVICTLFIVLFHFESYTRCPIRPFHAYTNGIFGAVAVTCFMILSGAGLHYSNRAASSLKKYYFKRWKAIYPTFYIVFLYFFIQKVFETGDLFYNDKPWTIIYSILAVDGYVDQFTDTYYLVGEWFLGAIVILYLLFPVLERFRRKNRYLTTAAVAVIYIATLPLDTGLMYKFRTLPVCLLSFYSGFLFVDYREKLTGKISCIIAAVAALVLLLVRIPLPQMLVMAEIKSQILAFALFVLMFILGEILLKNTKVNNVFSELARISFPIFLVQTQVILKMTNYQNPDTLLGSSVYFIIILGFTIVAGKAFSILAEYLMNTTWFGKIESYFISEGKK